ncbi:hypothetical protein R3P38DRAFT_2967411, partial [Favolaschia claudopus]
MMGRWKSVDLCFSLFLSATTPSSARILYARCPFSARTRKTRPRADQGENYVTQIMRTGIPYGP